MERVITLTVAVLLVLGMPSPIAEADDAPAPPNVAVTASDVHTSYDGCAYPTYTVTPTATADDNYFQVVVEVIGPGGTEYDYNTYTTDSSEPQRFNALGVCHDTDPEGTYVVTLDWTLFDEFNSQTATGQSMATFTYTKTWPADSHLDVKRKPLGATGWRFEARLLRAGQPASFRELMVQARTGGSRWQDIQVNHLTNRRGIARWAFRKPERTAGRYQFRVVFAGERITYGAHSSAFRLPYRGR